MAGQKEQARGELSPSPSLSLSLSLFLASTLNILPFSHLDVVEGKPEFPQQKSGRFRPS